MSAKKSEKGFLLRIDQATMELVERWAASEFRSVNGQLQWIINDSLLRYGRKKKDKSCTDGDDVEDETSE